MRTPLNSHPVIVLSDCRNRLHDPAIRGLLGNGGILVYEGEPGKTGPTQLGLQHRMEVFRTQDKVGRCRLKSVLKAPDFSSCLKTKTR